MSIAVVEFESYEKSVAKALDSLNAGDVLAKESIVLVKPNLICNARPPVTTPVACCEAIVNYVRACSGAKIIIAEGCGAPDVETTELYDALGYTRMAKRLHVELVDLNHAPLKKVERKANAVFPEIYLPKIAFGCYLISVAVLKAHSIADITGTLKNMLGLAPPAHYERGGHWKKSAFHARMQQSIVDLNRCRSPDLSVIDATVGLAEFHLGGRRCKPPVNKIVAGFDPLEVDRKAADMLSLDWRHIGHIAEGVSLR